MVGEQIKYLLAVLNSRLIHWYFHTCTGTTSGVGTNRWLKYTVETIPIPRIEQALADQITALVDTVLAEKEKGNDTNDLEQEIDALVLRAYRLSDEEREFILCQQ